VRFVGGVRCAMGLIVIKIFAMIAAMITVVTVIDGVAVDRWTVSATFSLRMSRQIAQVQT
jgi:hypothetical protein